MINTIEKLNELFNNNIDSDTVYISYKEWLECLKSLLFKINNNLQFNYAEVGSLILFVDISDLDDKDKEFYNHYCSLLRNFFGLYQYGGGLKPKDCWNKVVNNPDIYIEPNEYTRLT